MNLLMKLWILWSPLNLLVRFFGGTLPRLYLSSEKYPCSFPYLPFLSVDSIQSHTHLYCVIQKILYINIDY